MYYSTPQPPFGFKYPSNSFLSFSYAIFLLCQQNTYLRSGPNLAAKLQESNSEDEASYQLTNH